MRNATLQEINQIVNRIFASFDAGEGTFKSLIQDKGAIEGQEDWSDNQMVRYALEQAEIMFTDKVEGGTQGVILWGWNCISFLDQTDIGNISFVPQDRLERYFG